MTQLKQPVYRFLTLAALLVVACGLTAQTMATVNESNVEYDKRTLPSLTITIEAPVEAVYDPWQDFWEDRYDIDIDRSDKDGKSIAYLAEQVNLSTVSPKALDLYSNVDGTDRVSTVSMALAFAERDLVTSVSQPEAFRAASALLQEFRTYFYTTYFDERIATVREDLSDLRDDSQDASKDAEKARRKIEKYQDKIKKLERRIEDTREEVGEELETAEEKATRVNELEAQLRNLESNRRKYLG